MKKVKKGDGGVVNIWSLKEKIARMTFVNPNIPALIYGTDTENEAVDTFAEYIKNYHQDCIISTKPCHTLGKVHPFNVMFVLCQGIY